MNREAWQARVHKVTESVDTTEGLSTHKVAPATARMDR